MPADKKPLDELSRILAGLGQTPDQVAEVLRASGCRGFRTGSLPSPIIRYAYRHFDEGTLVLAYSPRSTMWPERLCVHLLDGRLGEVPLPEPVAEFLARFDEGAYPDLDLELNRTPA
jgi:hypothetical protein